LGFPGAKAIMRREQVYKLLHLLNATNAQQKDTILIPIQVAVNLVQFFVKYVHKVFAHNVSLVIYISTKHVQDVQALVHNVII